MSVAVQDIPKSLIYEMVDGVPIYYKGYRDYLNGTKKLEDVMASSILQAALAGWIVTKLNLMLAQHYGKQYLAVSNELGIFFKKKSWRGADLAIVERNQVKTLLKELNNEYLKIAPKIVIEIDTKADLSAFENPSSYYQKKTKELLDFGVERVIWIYTETQTVMFAQAGQPWQLQEWTESFEVMENVMLNIPELIEEMTED